MRKNEIKRTIEEVVRVEYIAEDGTVFYSEDECRKYEESAVFAVSSRLKRLTTTWTSQEQLLSNGQDECELEIFDVQTDVDLANLRQYLYLKALKNGARDEDVRGCFTSVDGKRKNFVFDSVTVGHEVLIFWAYDQDWFWTYKDGSLQGYFDYTKERYLKIINPEEATK